MKTTKKMDIGKLVFVANVFRTVCNPDRLRILDLIEENDSMSVVGICEKMNLSLSHAYSHLRLMRKNGILKKTRKTECLMYSVNYEVVEKIIAFSNKQKR